MIRGTDIDPEIISDGRRLVDHLDDLSQSAGIHTDLLKHIDHFTGI